VPEGDTPLDDVPDLLSINGAAASAGGGTGGALGDISKLWCDQDGSMKGLPGGDDEGRVTDEDLQELDFSGMGTDYGKKCYYCCDMCIV
jgi:hypothetical protein